MRAYWFVSIGTDIYMYMYTDLEAVNVVSGIKYSVEDVELEKHVTHVQEFGYDV